MSLEDLERLRCETEGVPYMPPEQRQMLEAADEANYQQQMQQQQMRQSRFDTRPQGIDVYFLDRLVSVKLTPKKDQIALWIMECSSLLEQLTLTNLNSELYNRLVRDFIEITDIADGEGNEEILQSLINRWIVELLGTKSRGDIPMKGVTERIAWVTQRSNQESIVKMPEQEQRKGFLGLLPGSK